MPLVHRLEPAYAPYRKNLWRVIEAQSRSSTVGIVDTVREHDVLEGILEDAKPPVPVGCRRLSYQFWSPFRYGRYPRDSRFRRAGRTPGVWYGAEDAVTAVCETAWGALRFFRASPGTPMPARPVEHTAVQADIATPVGLDLTAAEMADQGRWTDPSDYSDCLALADLARADGCEVIRYASVRHPDHLPNAAVLTCRAFVQPRPIAQQTWRIMLRPDIVRADCETLRQRHMFLVGETKLVHAA